MAKALGVIAIGALALTIGSTLLSIWLESARAAQFLELTKVLLGWQVIAGGLTLGAGVGFQTEVREVLKRMAR